VFVACSRRCSLPEAFDDAPRNHARRWGWHASNYAGRIAAKSRTLLETRVTTNTHNDAGAAQRRDGVGVPNN
jgi:hypothetical protein